MKSMKAVGFIVEYDKDYKKFTLKKSDGFRIEFTIGNEDVEKQVSQAFLEDIPVEVFYNDAIPASHINLRKE